MKRGDIYLVSLDPVATLQAMSTEESFELVPLMEAVVTDVHVAGSDGAV